MLIKKKMQTKLKRMLIKTRKTMIKMKLNKMLIKKKMQTKLETMLVKTKKIKMQMKLKWMLNNTRIN